MKKFLRTFALIAAAAIGAAGIQNAALPALAAMWQWSTTANSNATADPTINWAEGMSPSSVNDSARAMMAAMAGFRNDISGITTTGGSTTAYTLTSGQGGFANTTERNGFTVGFILHASNGGGGTTLNVDGAGAFPLRSVTGVPLSAGALVASQVRHATFVYATAEWRLHDVTVIAGEVPIGAIIDYTGAGAPNSNWAEPQNQCISTSVYTALFGIIGHTYSVVASCPGGTFGLPDTRGRVIAANDTGLGLLPCSDTLGCGSKDTTLAIGNLPSHQHTFSGNTASAGAHSHQAQDAPNKNAQVQGGVTVGVWSGITTSGTSTDGAHTHAFSGFTDFTGGGAAFSNIQPTITMRKIMRIL